MVGSSFARILLHSFKEHSKRFRSAALQQLNAPTVKQVHAAQGNILLAQPKVALANTIDYNGIWHSAQSGVLGDALATLESSERLC